MDCPIAEPQAPVPPKGQIDLHPETVSNAEMGLVFEELIRKFAELSNETAGEHFTPREVIKLMVNLIFIEDDQALTQPSIVRSLYDPTAGTGGMLSVAEEHLMGMNPTARLVLSGQKLNPESYAICKADMLIKGQYIQNIRFGNTLADSAARPRTSPRPTAACLDRPRENESGLRDSLQPPLLCVHATQTLEGD